MKRLLAQIGITYFSVLAVAFYLSDLLILILAGVALILSVLFLIIRKTRRTIFVPAMALAALVACLVNLGFTHWHVLPLIEKYADSERVIRAVVSDEPYRYYTQTVYPMEVRAVDGEEARFRLLLYSKEDLGAQPDDLLTFSATLSKTENDTCRSRQYFLNVDDYRITEHEAAESHSLYFHLIKLREKLRSGLNACLPADCAALCRAVFIGDKYALDTDTLSAFRYAGASYFIVVSGMHFVVICGLIARLLRRLRNRWLSLILSVLFILMYMALTGFRPSVLRAGIMMLVYMTGSALRRQTYSPNHLGLAGVLIPFIVSPYGAGDVGLILSFYATLAILLWATPILNKIGCKDQEGAILRFHPRAFFHRLRTQDKKKTANPPSQKLDWLKKLWNIFASVLAVSMAVNILVFPLSVIIFRGFSLVTLLSSVLLYYWIYLILLLSMAVAILFWLGPLRVLTVPLAALLTLSCRIVLWIVRTLADLPFSYIPMREDYLIVWIISSALFFTAAYLCKTKRKACLRYAALGSALVFIAGALLHTVLNLNTLTLRVFESESGICAGVDCGGRFYLLSTECSSKTLYNSLRKLERSYGGAELILCPNIKTLEKLEQFSDREFAISGYLLYDDTYTANDPRIRRVGENTTFVLGDDLTLTTYLSKGHVLSYLRAGNSTLLLLPKTCSLSDIPESLRRPDIIVMPSPFAGADALTCADLILGGGKPLPLPAYSNICLTAEGDSTYDLR